MTHELLTAWLSWCGGVTFTLMIVFALASSGVVARVRGAVGYAAFFAVLTVLLALMQAARLGYA